MRFVIPEDLRGPLRGAVRVERHERFPRAEARRERPRARPERRRVRRGRPQLREAEKQARDAEGVEIARARRAQGLQQRRRTGPDLRASLCCC